MAQVLVTRENTWYQGIASLKNLREKELEHSILRYASAVFTNYHCFQSSFSFTNKAGERANPDILIISKDFKKWLIVEVELVGKNLTHTKMQLRVFTAPLFDVDKLVEHCISKNSSFDSNRAELRSLFQNMPPEVLVIYDSYLQATFDVLSAEFSIKICVFEVYRATHECELYRLSGDYPYVYSGSTFLKQWPGNYELFKVQRPEFFDGLTQTSFMVEHRLAALNISLLRTKNDDLFVKIPGNPFPAGRDLKIYKTQDDKFVIDKS